MTYKEALENQAKQDIPKLRKWLNQLLQLSLEIQNQRLKYLDDDHFAFVVLAFFGKQVDHTRSLLKLGVGPTQESK